MARLIPVFLLLIPLLAAPPVPDDKATAWRLEIEQADNSEGEYPAAQLPHLRAALALAESFGPQDARLVESLARLSLACSAGPPCAGDESERLLRRALGLRSQIPKAGEATATALLQLGTVARELNRLPDAQRVWQQLLELRESSAGRTSAEAARVWAEIALTNEAAGAAQAAREAYEQAIALRRQAGAGISQEVLELEMDYAGLLERQQAKPQLSIELDKALGIAFHLWGEKEKAQEVEFRVAILASSLLPEYAERHFEHHVVQRRAGGGAHYVHALRVYANFLGKHRPKQAPRLVEEALKGVTDGESHTALLGLLAEAQETAGDLTSAAVTARRFVDETGAADPLLTISALSLLVRLDAKLNDQHAFARDFETLRKVAQTHGPEDLISVCEELSRLFEKRQDQRRTIEMLELAIATREAGYDAEGKEMVDDLMRLSGQYSQRGRPFEALALQRRAFGLLTKSAGKGGSAANPGLIVLIALLITGAVMVGGALLLALVAGLLINAGDRRLAALRQAECRLDVDGVPIPPGAPQGLTFQADAASLLSLRIINLSLSLLSLGLYSFWGKARVRRYLCSQAEYAGDRFAFHGRGGELLRGWLRGLPLLALLALTPYLLPLLWSHPFAVVFGQYAVLLGFLLLWPVARAGAYRYRLNRMSWRAIRFSFSGSSFRFFLLHLAGYTLTLLTFGIYKPFMDNRVRRYLMCHTRFGDRALHYDGDGKALFWPFFFALPCAVLSWGLYWPWYSAWRARYFWAHTTFAGVRCRSTATGFSLFRLWTGNFLLAVCTLGIALPWTTVRSMRYWTRHVEWLGEPDLASIHQDEQAAPAVGESFADYLGFDFGF